MYYTEGAFPPAPSRVKYVGETASQKQGCNKKIYIYINNRAQQAAT